MKVGIALAVVLMLVMSGITLGANVNFSKNERISSPYLEINGTIGENGWYISDVTITITWDPEEIAEVYYKIDGGEWTLYTEPIVISEDGLHTFYWYCIDNDGNTESTKSVSFKIDQTPPTIELIVEKTGTNTWLLTADVYDETSGVNRVEFYVNDEYVGNATEYPYQWGYSGSAHTAQAIVFDNAGNSEESEIIRNGQPVIELSLPFPPFPPFPPLLPTLRIVVTNIGDADATYIEWSFKWDGGWILGERFTPNVRETRGEIPVLPPGEGTTIGSSKFGLGHVTITIYAECAEGSSDELVIEAMMFWFVLIMQQPKV